MLTCTAGGLGSSGLCHRWRLVHEACSRGGGHLLAARLLKLLLQLLSLPLRVVPFALCLVPLLLQAGVFTLQRLDGGITLSQTGLLRLLLGLQLRGTLQPDPHKGTPRHATGLHWQTHW